MQKSKKIKWLSVGAGVLFIAAGVANGANTFYAIGGMFLVLGFVPLIKAK
ncbi:hypothetical protein [Massilia sp. Root335]|jgi:hypothetical protein|nr:hypothetical protein [Massilia sp. Root335]